MKKVYQTIIDKNKGDCMRAAVASLFELPLNKVPDFMKFDGMKNTSPGYELHRFFFDRGFDYCYINRREDLKQGTKFLKKVAKFDGGINGFFYASVKSQTFEGRFHAVIIDSNLNIVHDPNPNGRALLLKPDDVEGFIITKDMVIGKTGKLFTMEKWDKASEEERDKNTHHKSK
jgi:hypothetical protein